MIAPNMATMLAFVFTDAAISPQILQALLTTGVSSSFNCITVDSDTSTNDTLLLAATGKAGNRVPRSIRDSELRIFRRALDGVLTDLAIQVVRDGEGASKLITIEVDGASSPAAARTAALAVANSPLVKTAIAGEDANWGRVVMAVGKSGARAIPPIRAGFIEDKWYRGRGSNPHDPKGHRILSPVLPEPYIENSPVFLALTRDR